MQKNLQQPTKPTVHPKVTTAKKLKTKVSSFILFVSIYIFSKDCFQ